MKFQWDKKYLYWGITAFIVIACSIMFYDLMHNTSLIISFVSTTINITKPIIYGLIIAYLLSPIVDYLSAVFLKLCRKIKWDSNSPIVKKRIRSVSVLLTMVLAIALIYGLFALVVPQLITSITNIAAQFPVYEQNLEAIITKLLVDNPQIESMIKNMLAEYSGELTAWINKKFIPQINEFIKNFSVGLIGFIKVIWNLVIGLIISIYVLGSKELYAGQSKKIIYALFSEKHANNIIKDCRFVNKTFGGYISAKLVDSLIIGMLCFIGTTILNMPYALLVSVIVGVTNIIPFFGPYIGAIPSILLILMVDPMKALYFTIFVLLLQQFDGNFLGPKILGDSTGLSGFWVIFSITLFGGYWGVIGMAIGVPVFAVLYAFARRYANQLLQKKQLTTDSLQYMNVEVVVDNKFVPIKKQKRVSDEKNIQAKEEQSNTQNRKRH